MADGDLVVQVAGEIDLLTTAQLTEVLSRLATDSRPLVIELSQTTFIDSTGLTALLRVVQSRQSAGLVTVLREPAPVVLNTLEIAGLRSAMTIEGTTDQKTRHRPPPPGSS